MTSILRDEKLLKTKTIITGLLILFLHSKHCRSSRGPQVLEYVNVCVCACVRVCCVQQQGGIAGPVFSFELAMPQSHEQLITSDQ